MAEQPGSSGTVDVLLVEDSATQALLVQHALSDLSHMKLIGTMVTGEKALQFLKREGEHADAPRPNLVLLDINLPGISGFDVLGEMKKDPVLRQIPVVMLTASNDEQDVAKSYDSGAATYINKPVQPDDFQNVLKQFGGYWATAAKLPPKE